MIDKLVEQYISLHPFQYCSLHRFELQQAEQHQILLLELKNIEETRQLFLKFEGIIGLEFLPYNFQPVPLYLEIVWIGDRQCQGLNYQVFNTEQDVRLSFYCREFQVETKQNSVSTIQIN